jgi:hypothetical protein
MLDDLDDLFSTVALVSERIRKAVLAVMHAAVAVALPLGGVLLALVHPPLALATAILLFVTLLYQSVTSPTLEIQP